MRPINVVTSAAVFGGASAGFLAGLLIVTLIHVVVGETTIVLAAPQAPSNPSRHARLFTSDAALVLNFIKPDKTSDFERVIGRLREAFQKSSTLERKQQAVSWKVFKALEPAADGSTLYVFSIDPVVKGADYTESTVLNEIFPEEVQALFRQYADAFAAGQNLVNLKLVSSFGQ